MPRGPKVRGAMALKGPAGDQGHEEKGLLVIRDMRKMCICVGCALHGSLSRVSKSRARARGGGGAHTCIALMCIPIE